MGRQQYLIRLALGRSPYEAPESSNSNILSSTTEASQACETPNSNSDYVQQYDERGHPTFPRSKALARDLRRAKNDVLSTMGVVVSGETGRPATSKERRTLKTITAENDYGLLVVAFDNMMSFFGTWWIMSLVSRIQTFKKYSVGSILDVFQSEIDEIGWTGILSAGIPTWTMRIVFPIFRTHVLEPTMTKLQQKLTSKFDVCNTSLVRNGFSLFRLSVRSLLFVLFEQQSHMFCFLQAFHLIPYSSFPTASFFIPFTNSSLIRYPSFPTTFCRAALRQLASDLFAVPFALVLTHTFVQPFVKDRIYRLLRRQLPKQANPDELSIKVAVDDELLEWTLPAAGRNMEYETYRSNLSVIEDIKEEFRELKRQVFNWLGWNQESPSNIKNINPSTRDATGNVRVRNSHNFETEQQEVDGGMMSTPVQSSFDTGQGQILANEQLTHSPAQITPVSLDGLRPVGRTRADSNTQRGGVETTWFPFQNNEQRSRSNTLFSRPASPESPLTSPRIRASLTHQNSFTTTMEISLQSSRNRQRTEQVDADVANLDSTFSLEDVNFESIPLNLVVNQQEIHELESMRLEGDERDEHGSPEVPDTSEPVHLSENLNTEAEDTLGSISNENELIPTIPAIAQLTVLPDMVEEPPHSPTTSRQENLDILSDAGTAEDLHPRSLPPRDRPAASQQQRQQQQENDPIIQQRVTVLSSFPVDGLAHHLASIISTVIFIPFRSLSHRALATAYLSTPAAAVFSRDLAISSTDIRGLNAFAGGGSRQDMIAYMGKLAMVIGFQATVSGGILSISTAAAMEIGKRMFGWGRL